MTNLKVAIAQIDTCVGDVVGNVNKVVDFTRQAAAQGADLVVFPEMTVTGYPIEDLALRGSFQRAAEEALAEVAYRLSDGDLREITVVVGTLGSLALSDHVAMPRPTNRAVVIRGGKIVAAYDKHHLPNYGVFDEYRIFAPGNTTTVIEVAGHRVGLAICEDIWQDGGPVHELEQAGIDVLVTLNGSPYEEGKRAQRVELAARRAAAVNAPLVYANQVGGQDDLVFDGGSFVVGPSGAVLARAPKFEEHLLLWTLTPGSTEDHTGEVTDLSDLDEEVYQALVTGLQGYVTKNGFRTVVLGLSGGIDSALVAAIAADALGGQNVYGVSMPSRYSSEHSKDDAADLAKRLGAHYRVQPIGPMFDAFQDQLGLEGVAEENLQARVRGMTLMALSNAEGHLVLATGNKTELAVGYSTIYGDAVGGYAPIKDVDKSRVWQLSRWRNNLAVDRGEIPPIPESSITKPPSAELRPGQVDQDSLPPYDLLDKVLDAHIEHAEGRLELIERGFDPEIVDKVVSLVDRAEWKRRQYPMGPKVTALAFGRDRRVPVTSRWREPHQ
ncbi:NAD+ synthase [Jonesia quinghaiensis]|uniref:NAD+ synthase n=1 Tax=Jonesia quinghaiensis TaxID=262806 RepID=UPI0003F92432|nr:NAD+ synthase [Jonesia quinghaiensis]